MEIDEIIKELEKIVDSFKESLDDDAEAWAKLKAKKEHYEELKKVILAKLKSKYSGSNPVQENMALQDPEWGQFLEDRMDILADYYTEDYKKNARENVVDVLRSLLSFHKQRINDEI